MLHGKVKGMYVRSRRRQAAAGEKHLGNARLTPTAAESSVAHPIHIDDVLRDACRWVETVIRAGPVDGHAAPGVGVAVGRGGQLDVPRPDLARLQVCAGSEGSHTQ